MPVRLTETERRVAELYGRGMRPREIAEALGISINTVYKALSKARRAAEEEAAPPARPEQGTSTYSYTLSVMVVPAALGQPPAHVGLEEQLRRLEELLARLESLLRHAQVPQAPTPPPAEARPPGNGHMPEHLRKNVWVSLIRSRA